MKRRQEIVENSDRSYTNHETEHFMVLTLFMTIIALQIVILGSKLEA
jgi:hypothetical protein